MCRKSTLNVVKLKLMIRDGYGSKVRKTHLHTLTHTLTHTLALDSNQPKFCRQTNVKTSSTSFGWGKEKKTKMMLIS